MQVIPRLDCVVCNSPLPSVAQIYAKVPVYMGVTTKSPSTDLFADQRWTVCNKCGCVQLTELLDPSVLYAVTHTPGTVGSTWTKHHTDFAEFVARKNPRKVLEVGAGTTLLASLVQQRAGIQSYTILDPNVIDRGDNVRIIRELLTSNFHLDEKFDTIIHSHTLEHFYTPVEDLKALARLMTDDGTMVVSVPLIVNSVIDGFANGLNFEHTYMTTVSNLYTLFGMAGLHITTMASFSPHNVFITAVKEQRHVAIANEANSNRNILARYFTKLLDDIRNINEQIKGKNSGSVYLFGAHVFSQVLVSCGLSKVYCVLDNDPNKHDKRLYGTSYQVYDPSLIRSDGNAIVILRAGQYSTEIAEQLRTINPKVTII